MSTKFRCPRCAGPSRWENNLHRPFCSQRCRMIDLGHWLEGDYRLEEDPRRLSEEDHELLEKELKKEMAH